MLPNVSICADEPGVVYFNPAPVGPTYESVDLGLPSGKKWAKCNIGATSETGYGDYFMWGSTTPDTNNTCDWAHAPFNNGQSEFDMAYFWDHKSEWLDGDVLKPEYDAAHVIMGGGWRMPTETDCRELLSGTTNVWTTVDGVNGRLFTSKTNGNTMFIPATGFRDVFSFRFQGDYGNVWSSSIDTNSYAIAKELNFDSDYSNVDNIIRCYGCSVRGVLD